MTEFTITPEFITQAGLKAKLVSETATRMVVEVTDVFLPVHIRHGKEFQITHGRADFLRNLHIGQRRTFWKTGTRAGFEVGSQHRISGQTQEALA